MTATPDRFTLELIKGALNAARSEMEALIARTAMSPFIREKKDYFTAFLNPKGELVVSTSLTLAGNLVDAVLVEYDAERVRPGPLAQNSTSAPTGAAKLAEPSEAAAPAEAEQQATGDEPGAAP